MTVEPAKASVVGEVADEYELRARVFRAITDGFDDEVAIDVATVLYLARRP